MTITTPKNLTVLERLSDHWKFTVIAFYLKKSTVSIGLNLKGLMSVQII